MPEGKRGRTENKPERGIRNVLQTTTIKYYYLVLFPSFASVLKMHLLVTNFLLAFPADIHTIFSFLPSICSALPICYLTGFCLFVLFAIFSSPTPKRRDPIFSFQLVSKPFENILIEWVNE